LQFNIAIQYRDIGKLLVPPRFSRSLGSATSEYAIGAKSRRFSASRQQTRADRVGPRPPPTVARSAIAQLGSIPTPGPPKDLAAFIAAKRQQWVAVVETTGVKID
jgi:hypothetical protein